jgi:hypothetical protein
MRPRVNHLFAQCTARAAIAGVLFTAPSASAQDGAGAPFIEDRWIPSFAFTSGIFFGRQHGSVSSECFAPGSNPPASTSCDPVESDYGSVLRPGEVDDELAATPYVGGNLSLLAPAFAAPGRPRLFASFELPYQFGIDRNVAQKQRPTGIREPENPNNQDALEALDETAMLGTGSRTRSEIQGLTFGASAGVAFAFEAFGRQFRVKPAAGWIRTEIDVRGRVEHGICVNSRPPPPGQTINPRDDCDVDGVQFSTIFGFTRVITLKGGETQWFDGIGPVVDLEMDTGTFGPFAISLFLEGAGYYFFGDRSIAFSAQQTIGPDALGAPVDYRADFGFRVSPWLYRAGLGLRFSWAGHD